MGKGWAKGGKRLGRCGQFSRQAPVSVVLMEQCHEIDKEGKYTVVQLEKYVCKGTMILNRLIF